MLIEDENFLKHIINSVSFKKESGNDSFRSTEWMDVHEIDQYRRPQIKPLVVVSSGVV